MNSPYLYHPHPLCISAAEDVCHIIASNPLWEKEFSKGKMLGVMILEDGSYRAAYSGIVDIEANDVFVPPVYDLNNPDDFYKKEERRISEINGELKELRELRELEELKAERKQRSQALQLEIFKHFNFINHKGETKNIVDIFADAKRGLPPGGSGECAAPRLLQFAFSHNLKPIAIAEFWYGESGNGKVTHIHKLFYPSCIEKCSPILKFMLGDSGDEDSPLPSTDIPEILFEDSDLIVLSKPAEVLSTPAKDTTLFNVETWLHDTHREVKGPMLVHRLDQSTSGVMIAAKNALAFKTLQKDFLEHNIRKRYLAWVEGDMPSECGVINLPICSNPDNRPRQVVDYQYGKSAITRYKTIKREEGETLLALYPFTGRTHQLRLHCASPFGLDRPIVGDRLYYSDVSARRLMLHAEEITFLHPVTKEKMTFLSPIVYDEADSCS